MALWASQRTPDDARLGLPDMAGWSASRKRQFISDLQEYDALQTQLSTASEADQQELLSQLQAVANRGDIGADRYSGTRTANVSRDSINSVWGNGGSADFQGATDLGYADRAFDQLGGIENIDPETVDLGLLQGAVDRTTNDYMSGGLGNSLLNKVGPVALSYIAGNVASGGLNALKGADIFNKGMPDLLNVNNNVGADKIIDKVISGGIGSESITPAITEALTSSPPTASGSLTVPSAITNAGGSVINGIPGEFVHAPSSSVGSLTSASTGNSINWQDALKATSRAGQLLAPEAPIPENGEGFSPYVRPEWVNGILPDYGSSNPKERTGKWRAGLSPQEQAHLLAMGVSPPNLLGY